MNTNSINVSDDTIDTITGLSHNVMIVSDSFVIRRGTFRHVKMRFACVGSIIAGEEDCDFMSIPMDLDNHGDVDVGSVEVVHIIKLPWGDDSSTYQSCTFVLMDQMLYGFCTTDVGEINMSYKNPLIYCEQCHDSNNMEGVISTVQKLHEHGFKTCFDVTNARDAFQHGFNLMRMRGAGLEYVTAAKACAEQFIKIIHEVHEDTK